MRSFFCLKGPYAKFIIMNAVAMNEGAGKTGINLKLHQMDQTRIRYCVQAVGLQHVLKTV